MRKHRPLAVLSSFLLMLPLQCKLVETNNRSNVLGRANRLGSLCDNFEDPEWHYPNEDGLWRGGNASARGAPELITRVTTPSGGKRGSIGALEIRTTEKDTDSGEDDLTSFVFTDKLQRKLTRADQPVFIVHVWLPPFVQWGETYCFGFRHESFLENGSKDQNYSSIFVCKQDQSKPFFKYRSGTNELFYEIHDPRPIEQAGWWTVAVAFDENGFDHYYAHAGNNPLTEKDKVFSATQLFDESQSVEQPGWWTIAYARKGERSPQYVLKHPGIGIPAERGGMFDDVHLIKRIGTGALLIDYFNYSFFSLHYPSGRNASPPFVIDDYEVWAMEGAGSGGQSISK